MGYLEFAVGMTQALAWPLLLFFVFIILRKQISAAISRMRTVKHGEVEFTFAQDLEQAKGIAIDAGVTVIRPVGSFNPEILRVLSATPTGAIIEGWKALELELKKLSDASGFEWKSPRVAIDNLKRSGAFGNGESEILDFLVKMRNKAVHEFESGITEGEAIEFLMLCKSMTERVQGEQARRNSQKTSTAQETP